MQVEESSVMVPWSFDANWTIYHGSLESCVTVESPEYPIAESHADDSAPLVLKPSRLDSGPCEIKSNYLVCFFYYLLIFGFLIVFWSFLFGLLFILGAFLGLLKFG